MMIAPWRHAFIAHTCGNDAEGRREDGGGVGWVVRGKGEMVGQRIPGAGSDSSSVGAFVLAARTGAGTSREARDGVVQHAEAKLHQPQQ